MSTSGTRSVRRAPARLLLVAAGSALLALPACATKGDMRDLQMEMAAMQERQDDAFQSMERRMAVLMDSIELTLELQRNAQGQSASQVRALGQDMQQLRNLVDDTQSRLERMLEEFARLGQLIDRLEAVSRSGGLPGGGAPPGSGGSGGAGGGTLTPPAPATASDEAREYYDLGMQYLNDESYQTARAAFEQIVADFPDDPYAARAQLKIAESYAGQRRVPDALEAFEAVWTRWPEAEVVPEALYRAGFVAAEAGENGRARAFWERLIRDHADSDAARLAEEGLRRIRG